MYEHESGKRKNKTLTLKSFPNKKSRTTKLLKPNFNKINLGTRIKQLHRQ